MSKTPYFQWKMSFNSDTSKQVQEVILTQKLQKLDFSLHFIVSSLKETSMLKEL